METAPNIALESHQQALEAQILERSGDWVFDELVSQIFDVHVRRSIPMYEEVQNLIGLLSKQILQKKNAVVYDLGTSSGEVIMSIWKSNQSKDITFYGIDNSTPMLIKAQEKCVNIPNITFIHQCIQQVDYAPCDLIVSAFTLQFIPVSERVDLLRKLHKSLMPSGYLMIFEKIVFNDAHFNSLIREVHEDWKLQYFTKKQVALKKNQLRQVMHPVSQEENLQMFRDAGFNSVRPVFQWGNFMGLLVS